MTFRDLTPDWDQLPLEGDQHTADVLDLLVGVKDRLTGGVFILLCDEQRRPWRPIMISDDPDEPPLRPAEVPAMLANVTTVVTRQAPGATAVAAVVRPGPLQVSVNDRAMSQAISRAFDGQVPLLGVHLITPRGSVRLDPAPVG